MKLSIKKILIIILINIVIIFLFAVNQFIDNTYDMSLYKYMQYSIPLTQTEIDYTMLLPLLTLTKTADSTKAWFLIM